MKTATNTNSLIHSLRMATEATHQRLHQHVLLKDLISEQIQVADYIPVLRAFYGFYAAYRDIPASYNRRKWLKKDLEYFNCHLQECHCCKTRKLPNYSAKLGYLYVIEGSSLGSKLIYKNLQKSLGLSNVCGARYFYGHGQRTGILWRELLQTLAVQPQNAHATIVQSAQETFDFLEHWLTYYASQILAL